MKPNKFSVILFTFIIFSCQTNKIPRWVTEPPVDDDLFIYVVGNGIDSDMDNQKDKAYISVVEQLSSRFNLEKDEYLNSLITELLDSAFNNTDGNDDVVIADRWNNDEQLYILARFKRTFFKPIFELYSTRYNDMISYTHEYELEGDLYFEDSDLYKAFNSYSKTLLELLALEDEFYSKSIIRIMEKMINIVDSIMYTDIERFSKLVIGEKNIEKKFSFKILGDGSFDGFLYKINFYEGWQTRSRTTSIPVKNNSLEFIPPGPKVSGNSNIKSELTFGELIFSLDKWKDGFPVSSYLESFIGDLNSAVIRSRLEFNFDIVSNVKLLPKLISFNNALISEGVTRALLESENPVDSAPLLIGDEEYITYIREINMLTSDLYSYLILENEITENSEDYDGGLLIKISGSFSLIDLKTSKILLTQSLSIEYLGEVGDENYAYLDFGLKAGEIINGLKF